MGISKGRFCIPIATLVLALGTASAARAARLQALPADIVKPPAPVLPPGSETPTSEPFVVEASVSDTLFSLLFSFSDSVDCTNPMCSGSFSPTGSATVPAQIFPSEGERVGDPVVLCLRESYEIAASATGGYTAQTTVGGVPITDPTKVVRTPGNVVVFSDGPHTVTANNTARQQFTQPFEALVGDVLTVTAGVQLLGNGTGIGSAQGEAIVSMSISFGPCVRPAPAASRNGLAVLALSLASIGAFVLRRRMR
jgi:hypothetical protein